MRTAKRQNIALKNSLIIPGKVGLSISMTPSGQPEYIHLYSNFVEQYFALNTDVKEVPKRLPKKLPIEKE